MSFCHFLEHLLGEGRAVVPAPHLSVDEPWETGDAVLAENERIWRHDLPEPVPAFIPSAARWAAVWLYRACQFAVHRDVDEQAVQQALAAPFPAVVSADTCYSVDLTFRFLPDLERFARSAAEHDPLVVLLRERAAEWPLSSVGITDIGDVAIGGFAGHPGLMQLYADRIIAAGDVARMADPRVRSQIESSLGMFPTLAPRFAADGSGSRAGSAE